MIVLDASITVTWLLDEPSASDLESVLSTERIIVPSHWTVEVGHAILKALRRNTIRQEQLVGIASDLDGLSISIQPPIDVAAIVPLLNFAWEHGLTMYDAGYVQLALNRTAKLATLDKAMGQTAAKLGIEMLVE
ncbi:type II toxin-antitoxin system VapC family toxin [Bradyrhizobium sp.]|uniref:type II toxin-antitoxin system VapC family toxin n=1 Tax=Bradyrhizobium sp. TaxID=376 RepID=UPI002DFB3087|nr:type II toxin-antitoxin system VapC family toxin [Bradyrhizobium sp.]